MDIYLVDGVIKLFNNQALKIISECLQNCTFEVQIAFNIAENLMYNCLSSSSSIIMQMKVVFK